MNQRERLQKAEARHAAAVRRAAEADAEAATARSHGHEAAARIHDDEAEVHRRAAGLHLRAARLQAEVGERMPGVPHLSDTLETAVREAAEGAADLADYARQRASIAEARAEKIRNPRRLA